MATPAALEDSAPATDNWPQDDHQSIGPVENEQTANPASSTIVEELSAGKETEQQDHTRGSSAGAVETFRERQVKPNKVYIGGLPEHTRQEDLQNCFGKLGSIVNIELKVGYGFVEFDTREAAEESVAKYHEGFFMGNKIRVELSHGGGRTSKYAGDPGACFKCGQMGHWARECPNTSAHSSRRNTNHEVPVIDRAPKEYTGFPARQVAPRDDYPRFPPRDSRYEYAPPREYRRPPSPRDYRDYAPPLPAARAREYDDYRRGPPPTPDRDRYPGSLPAADYRGRYPPLPDAAYRGYPVPPPDYDRYDRRPSDRPGAYPPSYRPRSPPRGREEYERPAREFSEYRGRPVSPPRYTEYNRVGADPPGRFRRRSESPRPGPAPGYDAYPINGYASGAAVTGPPGPPRGTRDYPPPRNGREILEPTGAYRRP